MALYGIKDSGDLTLIDTTTGKQVLFSDYCNQTSINMTADVVYAMKKTARAIAWDTAKEGTLTTEMQVFDLRWIALLMGSLEDLDGDVKTVDWSRREIVTLGDGGTFALKDEPKEGTITLFKLAKDGISLGDEIAAEGFSVSGKTLTVTNGAAGAKYCIFYLTPVQNSRTFTVSGNRYPHGYKAYLYTTIRDTTNNDTFVQFEFFNIKPKAQMELTMSAEDVCTLSVEWDMLVDNDNKFFALTYLEKDLEDEVVTDGYTKVVDPTGDPSEQGWYEKNNGSYVLTEDTTVTAGKEYYTKNQG